MLHYSKVLGPSPAVSRGAERLRNFLCLRGFRQRPTAAEASMKFTRGSSVATFFALDPARWRIDIIADCDIGSVQMFVHSDGHVVTPREKTFFDLLFQECLARVSTAEVVPIRSSEDAGNAALNENVTVTFAFLMLLPLTMSVFHIAMAVPLAWSIVWGFAASVAAAYAWLFSARNRPRFMSRGLDALPSGTCRPGYRRRLAA